MKYGDTNFQSSLDIASINDQVIYVSRINALNIHVCIVFNVETSEMLTFMRGTMEYAQVNILM